MHVVMVPVPMVPVPVMPVPMVVPVLNTTAVRSPFCCAISFSERDVANMTARLPPLALEKGAGIHQQRGIRVEYERCRCSVERKCESALPRRERDRLHRRQLAGLRDDADVDADAIRLG